MEEALSVGVRQGCYLLLFLLVFLPGMIPVASFDLKLHPHRLDWILEGTSLEFTCSFKNRNRPETIVWKNGERTIGRVVFGNACAVLKLDPEINITCDASTSKLRILQVRTQNRWNLRCQTDNGTVRSRSVTVKVLRKSKLFLSPMTDPLVKEEGSSATISCRVEGQGHYTLAYPSFTWFKDGLPVVHTTYRVTERCLNVTVVTPPDNVITSCGTYYSRVDIQNISLDDAGTWHCGYGPPSFGMTSKPITIIVEKTGTTTVQALQTTWTSTPTSDPPTMSSGRFIISTVSERTSPTSTLTSPMINLGMTTNTRSSNTVTSSTTSVTTAIVASTQSLSSTSLPRTKTTILQTSKPTSTLSSTTLPALTSITTTRSTQTFTENSPTSTTTTTTSTTTPTPTPTPTPISLRTSVTTESSTTTLTTTSKSTSMPISMTQTTSPSTPYPTSITTFLLTSTHDQLKTTTHHDDSSKIHKPTGHSFTTAVFSSLRTEIATSNLTGSDLNNGSARGEEVVLEGGTHLSPILIGCIIAAVVAIVIFVVIVVIIRRRRNQIVPVEENTFDVRVDISTQTSEDGMDTMT